MRGSESASKHGSRRAATSRRSEYSRGRRRARARRAGAAGGRGQPGRRARPRRALRCVCVETWRYKPQKHSLVECAPRSAARWAQVVARASCRGGSTTSGVARLQRRGHVLVAVAEGRVQSRLPSNCRSSAPALKARRRRRASLLARRRRMQDFTPRPTVTCASAEYEWSATRRPTTPPRPGVARPSDRRPSRACSSLSSIHAAGDRGCSAPGPSS